MSGLSTTTTSSGLLDEARIRPQVPSSNTTRTPLTVMSFADFLTSDLFARFSLGLKVRNDFVDGRRIFFHLHTLATWSAIARFLAMHPSALPSIFPGCDQACRKWQVPPRVRRRSRAPNGGLKKKCPDFSNPTRDFVSWL